VPDIPDVRRVSYLGEHDSVRAVSWNVWWRFGEVWRDRQKAIAGTLLELQPDVVGLQESWATDESSQAQEFGQMLDMHAAFAAPSLPPVPDPPESPDQIGVDLGVAVLSRWPLSRVQHVMLPARHRDETVVALLATLDHPRGPLHVIVACVEWDPASVDDHLAQTGALAELASSPELDGPLPVLITADLNAPPDSEAVRLLTTTTVDAWVAGSGCGEGVTLSSRNPFSPVDAQQQIDRRIDYILARPGLPGQRVFVRNVFVAGMPVRTFAPSDHYSVVADIDI
jgi:endonuclease/exonuclease/phosphatase family metal-dependent hydrolase